ncbi:MAG: HAD family hydrolase [Gammaproteobacteria bacterium]|nr:MAG: HAD family hydrolase [Gammaproteobacteria bacterium]
MSSQYKLIIFDWDGTLMDSEAHIVHSMKQALLELGVPVLPDDQLRQVIGLGLKEALATLVPGEAANFYQDLTDAYRKKFFDAPDEVMSLFNGIEHLIHKLHKSGYLLAVATGKSRRGLDRQFSETGLGEFFASSRCADESRSKPAPDMLNEILQELGISAEQALMVGDTEYDLNMSKAAGCDSLAICYGVHEKERLAACAPVAMIDSVDELHDWFDRHLLNHEKVGAM